MSEAWAIVLVCVFVIENINVSSRKPFDKVNYMNRIAVSDACKKIVYQVFGFLMRLEMDLSLRRRSAKR